MGRFQTHSAESRLMSVTDKAGFTASSNLTAAEGELYFVYKDHKSAKIENENLLFAFVDLRRFSEAAEPDVYLVPAHLVCDYCKLWVDHVKMARSYIEIEKLQEFKNCGMP